MELHTTNRGRPPMAHGLRVLTAGRNHRKRINQNPAKAPEGNIKPPRFLRGVALAKFREVASALEAMKIGAPVDADLVALSAVQYAVWDGLRKTVQAMQGKESRTTSLREDADFQRSLLRQIGRMRDSSKLLFDLLPHLGMTPSSRSRFVVRGAEKRLSLDRFAK